MKNNKTNSARQNHSFSDFAYRRSTKEYGTIFESLLIGTFILVGVVSIILLINQFVGHHPALDRIIVCGLALFYLAFTYRAWTKGLLGIASKLLIGFYLLIASFSVLGGGLNNSFSLLILAISIILSGVLLGAKYTLSIFGICVAILFVAQIIITIHGSPLLVGAQESSNFANFIVCCIQLGIFALVTWIFCKQTERLLTRSLKAEKALQEEKDMLEIRVEERTTELRQAQLDEVEQLYQFAEMGQLSAAMLHDLANHLAVLNFDIADLKKSQRGKAIEHVEESIAYIEHAVTETRERLKGKNELSTFNVVEAVRDSLRAAASKAADKGVRLDFHSPKTPPMLDGDPLRLSHVVNILAQNAIEAYDPDTPESKKIVHITVRQTKEHISIAVRDDGRGIEKGRRKLLFTPLKSTRKNGLGIGLFIAKKIVETHFKGRLSLTDTIEFTEFVVEVPRTSHA